MTELQTDDLEGRLAGLMAALSSLAERVTVLEQQVEQLQKLKILDAHLHDLEETPPEH